MTNFGYLGVFHLDFFRHCETFLVNFLIASKAPFNVFDILHQNGFLKIPKGSPFTFSGTMRLFKTLVFCLILGSLNTNPPLIFFQYNPNFFEDRRFSILCDIFLIGFYQSP